MNLMLHCGSTAVVRDVLNEIQTPEPTASWSPIAHVDLLNVVEGALKKVGLRTGIEAHGLTKDNNRYFGLLEVLGKSKGLGYSRVLGIRNSHDKSMAAGVVAGASVIVCDNLSFSGEVRIVRKHTAHIARDIEAIADTAVQQLLEHWNYQDKRIESYKACSVTDAQAHDLLIRATDTDVCPNRMLPHVLEQWRNPAHAVFKERTAWSLFNAFTESLKGNLPELPSRTTRLHTLFDSHVRLLS